MLVSTHEKGVRVRKGETKRDIEWILVKGERMERKKREVRQSG